MPLNPTLPLPGESEIYRTPLVDFSTPTGFSSAPPLLPDTTVAGKIASLAMCAACALLSAFIVAWAFWWCLCQTLSAPLR